MCILPSSDQATQEITWPRGMWYRSMQMLLKCHGVINTDPHWECTIRICKVTYMGIEKGCILISIHGSYAAPVLFIKFGIYSFVIDGKMSPVTNGYTKGCSRVKANSNTFFPVLRQSAVSAVLFWPGSIPL